MIKNMKIFILLQINQSSFILIYEFIKSRLKILEYNIDKFYLWYLKNIYNDN